MFLKIIRILPAAFIPESFKTFHGNKVGCRCLSNVQSALTESKLLLLQEVNTPVGFQVDSLLFLMTCIYFAAPVKKHIDISIPTIISCLLCVSTFAP
jgi:hypothetical protein